MFDWKRFMCPLGQDFALDDDGFLYDPDAEYGAIANPNVFSFEQIKDRKCVVVLGEPGIGKSTLLANEWDRIRGSLQNEDKVLLFDLGEYTEESRLVNDVLQHPDLVSETTTLFLDSLDECKIRLANVARILKRELRGLEDGDARFSLRISCRTADWPASLTELLCKIWGDEQVVVAKVVPLRRVDIIEASAKSGIEPQLFLQSVVASGCQPLAINPVTLKFLINHFHDHKELETNVSQLYESGCLALCSENNTERQESGDTGDLTPNQRLEIASRIAAVSVFCRLPLIVRNPQNVDHEQQVAIGDLAGYTETTKGNDFEISEKFVLEVLDTGLFSGRGPGCFGFAHQSYAEFLAARYLFTRGIDSGEISKIIFSDDESIGSQIHPPLVETCAWIFSENEELFSAALDYDPQSLIKSEVANADDSARHKLTSRLLELFQKKEISANGFGEVKHYSKLKHSKMAEQLNDYIRDRKMHVDARTFALKLATECDVKNVQDSCLQVSLSSDEPYYLRCQATRTLAVIGDDDRLQQLLPLAAAPIVEDGDLTLSTIVLRRLWPDLISANELFSILQTPRRDTYGSYGYFLSHELLEKLNDDDLPFAMDWAATLNVAQSNEFSVARLVAAISKRAWDNLWHPGVVDSMARFCNSRLGMYCSFVVLEEGDADDEDKRHAIVERILKLVEDPETDAFSLVHRSPQLIRSTDVDWILGRLSNEENLQVRSHWAKLLRYVADFSNPEHLDSIKEATVKFNEVLAEFGKDLEALDPDSAEGKRRAAIRQTHKLRLDELEAGQPPLLDPPPAIRVQQLIELCEQGDLKHWFNLTRELQLEETSTHFLKDFEEDITTLPGWQQLTSPDHERIIGLAKEFLAKEQCLAPEYFGKNSSPMWDRGGYKALALLAKLSPDNFNGLSTKVWDNWAASLVDHIQGSGDLREIGKLIEEKCVEKSPQVVADSIKAIVRARLGNTTIRTAKKTTETHISILPQITHHIWDETIRSTLYELASDRTLQCKVTALLVDQLLKNKCSETVELAKGILTLPIPSGGRERGLVITVGTSVLSHAPEGAWAILKPIFDVEPQVARFIVESVAKRDFQSCNIATQLTEGELADFYIWLEQQYPHVSDPDRSKPGFVGMRESVASYRDCILRVLEYRGTGSAIDSLQRIERELTHLDWLHRVIARARRIALRESWRPIAVSDFLTLTRNEGMTLVKSEGELQGVIIESLERLQVRLQAETPAAPDLWDTKALQPKDENHFSDYIKRHLESDLHGKGIISLREVEIRRGEGKDTASGKGKGERTDVHVAGVVPGIKPDEFVTVRVIIEVKGSWHGEVETAMETQLRGRYLSDNDCSHGIYVVGWYHCTQWDKKDGRYKKSKKETFEQCQARFLAQADDLIPPPNIQSFVINCSLR